MAIVPTLPFSGAQLHAALKKLEPTIADRAPLPSDDETQGYATGSRWQHEGLDWLYVGGGRWVRTNEVTPEIFGAGMTNDDAPAFRLAVAFLAARGGGVLRLRDTTYRLSSVETRTAFMSTSGSAGMLVPVSVQAPFYLPAGVSLIGPGRAVCLLDCSAAPTGMAAGVAPWDYSNGEVSGFRVKGRGVGSGAAHGLHLSFLSTSNPHVNRNIILRDLHLHDWASYGIGHQYGAPVNITVSDVLIEDTGADGVDWKVRFGPGNSQDVASGVVMDRVVVRRPGQRVTTAISALGIRGRAIISNIEVTGIKAGCAGIELDPGTGQGQEFRQPAARSTLSNFYIEGDDPGQEVVGLHCFSAGPLSVSNGYLRGCQVLTAPKTVSPTGFDDGPTISNVTVEGTRGYDAFVLKAPRSQMMGCRSLSDKEYFEERRGNLAVGQTTLTVTGGITGAPTVQKNGATMASGYTVAADTVTLAVAAAENDVFTVVQPSRRPWRVEALYCAITGGGADAHHSEVSGLYSSTAIQNATLVTGFFNEKLPAVTMRSTAAATIEPVSPNSNEDLRLLPKGAARVRFGSHAAGADAPVTGYITIKDEAGTERKLAVIS